MKLKFLINLVFISLFGFSSLMLNAADDDEEEEKRDRGGIEEITVTAEKRVSTVSDTSMSITAFDSSLIEDLGLQGANDLMDQLPATTRDPYDVRIRGVGRNFRALGGDPGVATYYNGVYSPDFGIAASENYYYDVERIEVLRGPQGTLYGRNSIGGAINYITKKPSFENGAEARILAGDYSNIQYYAMVTGPITDKIAFRATAAKMDRDGTQECINCDDPRALDDSNEVITLLYTPNDDIEFQFRINNRYVDNIIPGRVLLNSGAGPLRGMQDTTSLVRGLRKVTAGTPGAITFTNPNTGEVGYGAPLRAGVDNAAWPGRWNSYYGSTLDTLGTYKVQVNQDVTCRKFPYNDGCQSNHQFFEHDGIQSHVTWQLNDRTEIKYIYGYVDFNYTFNIDLDGTQVSWDQYGVTVLEDVHMKTHEININWQIGDDVLVTSGFFLMDENRQQNYSIRNNIAAIKNPANYGAYDIPQGFLGGASTSALLGAINTCTTPQTGWVGSGPDFATLSCRWGGDALGRVYNHQNDVTNDATAIFTQATWTMNDKFGLVLGARYAEDEKEWYEIRGGYSELFMNFSGAWDSVMALQAGQVGPYYELLGYMPWSGAVPELTPLAYANLIMGNAYYTGNPSNPIAPVCAIEAQDTCATPMRLHQGWPFGFTSRIPGADKWSDTNYRVNLDYTPNGDQLFYFGVTTGYRSGGVALGYSGARDDARDEFGVPTGAGLEAISYDKESVDSIEFGYKGIHLDDKLQLFASIYHYDYDGYQDVIVQYDPIRGEGAEFASNADGITNEGFEMEFVYVATDRLTLSGNMSYTETKYGEDYWVLTTDDPMNPPQIFGDFTQGVVGNAATGTDVNGDGVIDASDFPYAENVKGNSLKGIPKEKYTVRASYEYESRWGPVWFWVNHSFTGDFSASGIERALDRVPSRETTNLSASWWSEDYKTAVRFAINNVMDNDQVYSLSTTTSGDNYSKYGGALSPRTMYVDVRYRF